MTYYRTENVNNGLHDCEYEDLAEARADAKRYSKSNIILVYEIEEERREEQWLLERWCNGAVEHINEKTYIGRT